ncbi:MAG: hypothetical protein P1P63_09160 [Treponemataceae bacterium]
MKKNKANSLFSVSIKIIKRHPFFFSRFDGVGFFIAVYRRFVSGFY